MGIPGGGAALCLLGLTLLALSLSPFFLNCAVLLEDLKQRRKGKTVTILGESDQKSLYLIPIIMSRVIKGLTQILNTKMPSDKMNAVIIIGV